MVKCYLNLSIFTLLLKNKNIIFKIRRSKVTDYAALNTHSVLLLCFILMIGYVQWAVWFVSISFAPFLLYISVGELIVYQTILRPYSLKPLGYFNSFILRLLGGGEHAFVQNGPGQPPSPAMFKTLQISLTPELKVNNFGHLQLGKRAKTKSADQNVGMRRLVSAFVFHMQHCQGFSRRVSCMLVLKCLNTHVSAKRKNMNFVQITLNKLCFAWHYRKKCSVW